jgi:hypothetical protein
MHRLPHMNLHVLVNTEGFAIPPPSFDLWEFKSARVV